MNLQEEQREGMPCSHELISCKYAVITHRSTGFDFDGLSGTRARILTPFILVANRFSLLMSFKSKTKTYYECIAFSICHTELSFKWSVNKKRVFNVYDAL